MVQCQAGWRACAYRYLRNLHLLTVVAAVFTSTAAQLQPCLGELCVQGLGVCGTTHVISIPLNLGGGQYFES